MQQFRPTSIDLFCGTGGMTLGFEQAGLDVLAAFDLEEINVATQFENLAKALLAAAGAEVAAPTCSASFSFSDADGFIPLEGLIDRDAELARQRKEADRLRKAIESNEKKLENEHFMAKAPPDVLQQTRDTLDNYIKQLASVEAIIKALE